MLNPARLEFARTRRGWTKTRLARELGVQPRAIQGYESNEYAPEQDKLEKISELLQFPIEFFYEGDIPLIAENTASFRSMSKMSAVLKNTAFGMGSIAFMLNDWIEERFNLPKADLPDLSDLSPEDAAASLRRMWGLGEAPIGNLIHLLESRGVRVYSLAIEAKEVDAFSVWHKNCPFVFLNTFKSAEHSRFDAAHELGHLVRDRHSMLHGEAHSPEMEREAQAFASAFLMPRQNIIAHKPSFPGIPQLIKIKKHFGVSLAALAYRMNQLQLLTEWTYRNLCIQIAQKGYRTKEPEPMMPETSQVLSKVFGQLRQEGVGRVEVARQLNVFVTEIDNLTFGLTLSGVSSSGGSEPQQTNPVPQPPMLRVIK